VLQEGRQRRTDLVRIFMKCKKMKRGANVNVPPEVSSHRICEEQPV